MSKNEREKETGEKETKIMRNKRLRHRSDVKSEIVISGKEETEKNTLPSSIHAVVCVFFSAALLLLIVIRVYMHIVQIGSLSNTIIK